MFPTFNNHLERILCDLLLGLAPKSLVLKRCSEIIPISVRGPQPVLFVERMVKVFFVLRQTFDPKGVFTTRWFKYDRD